MEGKRFVKIENTAQKDGVTIIAVENPQMGVTAAKDVLYREVDEQTLLLLSGGSTPKTLYGEFAVEKTLNAGAVAMVDERPGIKYHANSNEKMIKETGLLDYLKNKEISFSPIIEGVKDVQETAGDYDKTVKSLFASYPKRVAILGIGEDGHTAGLPAGVQSSKFKAPASAKASTFAKASAGKQSYVEEFDNFPSDPKERITLTFKALSEMDLLLVLVFGSAKQNALSKMFEKGSIEEIPARFYTKPEIAKKVILITDQKV